MAEDTNDYLRDTISLMTAMEARLSSAEETKKDSNSGGKRRPRTTETRTRASSANSAAAKAKEAKEKAAQQWQRRKNYDPLKSMAKAKIAGKSLLFVPQIKRLAFVIVNNRLTRGHATVSASRDQYTDESSDVESAASIRGPPSNPRVALIRSDGGRHSLRQQKEDSGPQSLGSPIRRPPFKNNVMSQNGGRSTSSLSSKEAEFQVRFLRFISIKK